MSQEEDSGNKYNVGSLAQGEAIRILADPNSSQEDLEWANGYVKSYKDFVRGNAFSKPQSYETKAKLVDQNGTEINIKRAR